MDSEKLDTCSRDAISWLPDEVLGKILSLLPTKEAVSTSVLSKKWRKVFALVDSLDLYDSESLQPEEGKQEILQSIILRDIVERTLSLQRDSPIKKFFLRCNCDDNHIELAYVYRWIRNVVKRGVLEMDVSIKSRTEVYLPRKLFRSKTLVKLSLGTEISLGKIPPDASLPSLKSLFIDSIFFNEDDRCKVLLAGCPMLEELFVRHEGFVKHPSCICSQSIKKLSVHYDGDATLHPRMSFNAPSLVSLDYSDYALRHYPQVSLASLVEAKLDLRYAKGVDRADLTVLIRGISNVESLHLSSDAVNVICGCIKHGLVLPVLKNLVKLSFGKIKNERGLKPLKYMLKKSPKLETLIIEGLPNSYTYDYVLSLAPFQVKELRVLDYGGTNKEFKLLKSFVWKTESLEVVRVEFSQFADVDDDIISQFESDMATSLSSKCELECSYFI